MCFQFQFVMESQLYIGYCSLDLKKKKKAKSTAGFKEEGWLSTLFFHYKVQKRLAIVVRVYLLFYAS